MKKLSEERAIEGTIDKFLAANPEIATALDVFKISNEQYNSATEALRRPEFFSTNSTNPA